jgi:hypothetical protein
VWLRARRTTRVRAGHRNNHEPARKKDCCCAGVKTSTEVNHTHHRGALCSFIPGTPTRGMSALYMSESSALIETEQTVLSGLQQLTEAVAREPESITPAVFEASCASLRGKLRLHAESLERLEMLAATQERPSDEADVRELVRRHKIEGETLAAKTRALAARVHSNRGRVEAAERAALFALDEAGRAQTRTHAQGDGLSARASVQTARDVTASLRRTRQLMSTELHRQDATLQSLDGQSKSLKGTLHEHRGIDGVLGAGKRKMTRLQQRDLTDRVLIGAAFTFFLTVVLYIVKVRRRPSARASEAPAPAPDAHPAHCVRSSPS